METKQETKKSSFFQLMGSKLGDAGKVVGQAVSVASSMVGDKVEQAANAAKEAIANTGDDIADFATAKIKSIVADVNFDETLAALDKYTNESGKDVSALRNFIVELQKFAKDGSK